MNIIELCNMLGIHKEVQALLTECEKNIDFSMIENEMAQMKQPKCWENALENLKKYLDSDEDGMKILTCQLTCICDTYDKYQELGISNEIFIETMKFFPRFLQEYKDRHGKYCYVWAWWAVRQISMVEYRIGVLEYEMRMEDEKRFIDIHIPADADMSLDKLYISYQEALKFFEKYYPDFAGVDMICNSWLLAPALKNVLPENSRIIQFQNAFEVTSCDDESIGFMDWVYGSREIPIKDLPEGTTLQKNIKSYLLSDGKIGWAVGTLSANPFTSN